MVGQVHDRIAISCCAILDAQRIRAQTVIYLRFEIAWIVLFAVSAEIRKMQNRGIGFHLIACVPNTFVETSQASVQMILIIVLPELIPNAIQ